MVSKPKSDPVLSFRDIIKRAQRDGLRPDDPDRSLDVIANACGVSRQHLYNLMKGQVTTPNEWTLHRLSRGLGVPVELLIKAMGAPAAPADPTAADDMLG